MKKDMKKVIIAAMTIAVTLGSITGCGVNAGTDDISVVSREDGSGTRGAFVELFGVQEEKDGEKVDMTTDEANITNSTSVMMTTVASNENAIGYISLGALNDTVKAVKINGVEATADNIKSEDYEISRPFNIATQGQISEAVSDFISFIMSADGQSVVEDSGYIKVADNGTYDGKKPSGKIVVAGSSSVTPVMEKLKEAYTKVNPNASVEIQENDSSTGMSSTIDGVCDIGMASRELKESETSKGLISKSIAIDGIAVIVNKNSDITNLTKDQVKDIYLGNTSSWEDVK